MKGTTISKIDRTTPALICPNSRLPLQQEQNSLNSNDGQHTYPLIDNIPVFESLDEFYENRWSETDTSTGSLRNLLVKKQRFFVNNLKGRKGTVLDLGCGGGWKLFTKIGPVTGVDLSHSSLKIAQSIYDQVVQANWTKLPFEDNSFDMVVSSDVLGHVPFEDKEKVWNEIVRVLKPDGLTLHYIEANSNDPLMHWCRKYPDLYQKYVIDTEGHIGMESARDTMFRFRNYNLEPVREQGVYRLFMYLNRVPLLLDNEYRHKSSMAGLLVILSQILLKNKLTEVVTNLILVGLIEIADRILPEDWSNGVLVSYRKPTST
jgi:ubiquinone/menaquinone biosynthesis C-methylase UbiE